MLSVPSELFLVFQAFSLLLQLELPMVVMKSYILRRFSLFSRMLFHPLDDCCFLPYCWYLRMPSVSRYPDSLRRCHLQYSRMLLVHGSDSQELGRGRGSKAHLLGASLIDRYVSNIQVSFSECDVGSTEHCTYKFIFYHTLFAITKLIFQPPFRL